jgi:hypothetical protein
VYAVDHGTPNHRQTLRTETALPSARMAATVWVTSSRLDRSRPSGQTRTSSLFLESVPLERELTDLGAQVLAFGFEICF